MALPTAQLGGFPNINVPSFVPVVETSKRPKLWEQVLAQVLAQAAGGALNQGVQNAMTKDWAAESGEKPASFMQRVGRGPNVPQAEYVRRQGQKFDTEKMLAQAALTLGADSLAGQPSARDAYAAGKQDLANIDERTARKGDIIAQSKINRRGIRADNAREEARQGFETERDAQRLEADKGLRTAQQKKEEAQTAQIQQQVDQVRVFLEQAQRGQTQKPETAPSSPSYPIIPKGGVEVQPDVRERINARMGANSPFADRTNPQVLAQERGAANQRYQQGKQEAALGATEDETQRLFQELVVARVKDKMYNSPQTRAAVDSILTRLDELGRFPTN